MTQYISAGQLANRYNVNKATIWRWVKRGILPQPIRLSEQCTRFSLEEVNRRDDERRNFEERASKEGITSE